MSHNTWIHKLSRATIVYPLQRTKITPNHLTTFRLGTGIAASALIAIGSDMGMNLGACVFILSVMLDRADGDLARQTGQQSEEGHRYDLIADGLCNTVIFVALGIGLRSSSYGYLAPIMGVVAGLSVVGVLAYALHLEKQNGARAGEISGSCGFDPDDAILCLPLSIWLGWTEQLLLAASLGTPIFAIIYFFYFHALRRER